MKAPKLSLGKIILVLVLGIATWKALPVIDYFTGKTIHWKQEAPLHDGRMLIVERVSELGPSNPFDLSMRMEIKQTLSFNHPDTGEKLKWKIPDGLHPIMIDFDRGTPWSLMITAMSSDYSKWGCPNPPYLAYRYQKGKWKHMTFEEFPASLEWFNLILASKGAQEHGGIMPNHRYVKAEVVERVLGGAHWLRYPDHHPKRYDKNEQGSDRRRFSREKSKPIAFTERCGLDVLEALGREPEMDEKSFIRYQEENERWKKLPQDVQESAKQRQDKLTKEIKERLQ